MNLTVSLIGAFLGGLVFAATLYSGWQAFRATGAVRVTQGIACVTVIAAMASLSWGLGLDRSMGHVLTLISMANVFLEKGWNRVFPMVQFALAMTLAAGLALAV